MLSIYFTNKTGAGSKICLFQKSDRQQYSPANVLAWAAQPCGSGRKCSFVWNTNLSFVWGLTGPLKPGTTFMGIQQAPADYSENGSITLDYDPKRYFSFTDPQPPYQPGTLTVRQTQNIPGSTVCVGVAMNGLATTIMQAQPNVTTVFDLQLSYYMAWGNYTTGQLLDLEQMENLLEVRFPANVTALFITLNADMTWDISTVPF